MKRDRDRVGDTGSGRNANIDEANASPLSDNDPKTPRDGDVQMRALESYYVKKKKREKN